MSLRDRDGKQFTGTRADLVRHNGKLRQRERRARALRHIELPVGDALHNAMAANMSRGGFTDVRELLTLTQLNLAALPDVLFARVTAVPQHDVTDVTARAARKLRGSPGHDCPDWDGLHIRPGDPEFETCTCEMENDDD